MRLRIWGFASVVVVVSIACSEQREASYADRTTAERAGAIRQGWIPDWFREVRARSVNYTVWTCPGLVDTWVNLLPLPVHAAARTSAG